MTRVALPRGLCVLGDTHMACVLALGALGPGLLVPASACNDATPACPCGGTGRSASCKGIGATAVASLGTLEGLVPSAPESSAADPGSPSPGPRDVDGGAAPLPRGCDTCWCQSRSAWAQRSLAAFAMSSWWVRARAAFLITRLDGSPFVWLAVAPLEFLCGACDGGVALHRTHVTEPST